MKPAILYMAKQNVWLIRYGTKPLKLPFQNVVENTVLLENKQSNLTTGPLLCVVRFPWQ